ncbi:MAG TPA: hypothetical protein VII26_05820 [Candidatus Limnocylindria bacterium]
MRRSLTAGLALATGTILLLDLLILNPSLELLAGGLVELLILLAAAAAVGGAATLGAHHLRDLARGGPDRWGAVTLVGGMGLILVAGLRPGSTGSSDPAVNWLVSALLVPIASSLFALVFLFLLGAVRRGLSIGTREATVTVAAAGVMVVLLLPIGGAPGAGLATAAAWVRDVPLAAVFRGLLIGIAILVSVSAARILLGVGSADD